MTDRIEIASIYENAAIIVHEVAENEDGSATVKLDLLPEALRMVIEVGFITLIKQGLTKERTDGTSEA